MAQASLLHISETIWMTREFNSNETCLSYEKWWCILITGHILGTLSSRGTQIWRNNVTFHICSKPSTYGVKQYRWNIILSFVEIWDAVLPDRKKDTWTENRILEVLYLTMPFCMLNKQLCCCWRCVVGKQWRCMRVHSSSTC